MTDLQTVTTRFGRAYDRNKKAKAWLAKQQAKMFEAMTTSVLESPLRRTTILYSPEPMELSVSLLKAIDEYIRIHHPGWMRHDVTSGTFGIQIILDEDPSLVKYTYLNPDTEMVYGRTVVEGSPSLDDERLQKENPDLWAKITEWPEPWYSLIRELIVHSFTLSISDALIESHVGDHLAKHGIQRVLRDFSKLSDHDLALLQEYFVPGPKSVRLVAPRKATEEELGHNA